MRTLRRVTFWTQLQPFYVSSLVHLPPPSGRPTRVPHQDAVLGLWWSVLDAVKLVAGVLKVFVKVVLLRGVRGILP